jgi:prophage regulatory protein
MRKLLRLPAVMEMTGISESSVYRLVREKKFPQPIHVAVPKMTAWVSDDIENWIEEQIEKDRG